LDRPLKQGSKTQPFSRGKKGIQLILSSLFNFKGGDYKPIINFVTVVLSNTDNFKGYLDYRGGLFLFKNKKMDKEKN